MYNQFTCLVQAASGINIGVAKTLRIKIEGGERGTKRIRKDVSISIGTEKRRINIGEDRRRI
jgi:hypothetical protein